MPKVNEYFYSIQGEGPYVGQPSYFIRFAGGCLLRCPYCDSKFSWDKDKGEDFLEVIKNIEIPDNCNNIILTGGEPMRYWNDINLLSFVENMAPYKNIMFETTMIINKYDLLNNNVWDTIINVNCWFSQNLEEIDLFKYIISPKLEVDCYNGLISDYHKIFDYYYINDLGYSNIKWIKENMFYKIVYTEYNKSIIKEFIDKYIPEWFRRNIFMMPYTPIEFDKKVYQKSCEDTIEFCKEEGLIYSPRVHIDVYGLKKGV